jgi:hypothetical protein
MAEHQFPRPKHSLRIVPRRPVSIPADTADGHEGATDDQVGDRTGPGAGYDDEPQQVKDHGGVS